MLNVLSPSQENTMTIPLDSADAPHCIANKTYNQIAIGDSATLTRTLTKEAIQLFATVTGDINKEMS